MPEAYNIIDVRNEDGLHYNSEGVAELQSSNHATVCFARLRPGESVANHTHKDCEDNALVLSGTLSYPTGMAELSVSPGSWVVARPGELHGFANKGSMTVTLLLFLPKREAGFSSQATTIRARMFRPPPPGKKREEIYKTTASLAQQVTLTPGYQERIEYARAHVVFVMHGRIMAFVSGTKVSLDPGEGVFIRQSVVELVGVAGNSVVAVASTRP